MNCTVALGSVDKLGRHKALLVTELQQPACSTPHRKHLAIRRRTGCPMRCNHPGEAADSQETRRHGNEKGYSHHGQGAPRGSVVNAASCHAEIRKKSLVTAPWRLYVRDQCRNTTKVSIRPCSTQQKCKSWWSRFVLCRSFSAVMLVLLMNCKFYANN